MSHQSEQYQPPSSAPNDDHPQRSESTVEVVTHDLKASDGVTLRAKVYSDKTPVKLTALLLPGIGVPQRAFRHLARWLAVRGARCVTVDYRGMGESATPNGISTASLSKWAQDDVATAMAFCKRMGPEPVVLIGHSFGGQSVGLNKALRDVRAAVFLGSQFGRARNWDGMARWWLALYWHVFLPLVSSLFQVLPRWSGPAGPLPRGVAQEWARWGRSRDWYISQFPESANLLATFKAPILAFGISDDTIAPPRAVADFLNRFSSTVPIRRNVRPADLGLKKIGHTGMLRPSHEIETIWEETLSFLCEELEVSTQPCVSIT